MNLLALDTSSLACSVALQLENRVICRHEEQAREHTRLLVPMINEVLAEGGVSSADLDAVVLGNGPGSFIGMRIATSVAQGLAHGAGIKIVPVSSMLGVAAQVAETEDAGAVAVCQDAHMDEVYLGLYAAGSDGVPELLGAERLHDQSIISELQLEPGRFTAAGFGWQRYPRLLETNRALLASVSAVSHPAARYLLATGAALAETGAAVDPQAVVPAYLRQTVAKPARPPGP
ncbi:MAG: tRNA (adenosine(37)-N6)-threonylcarbamoyltransferase complex dimerization subunit type 1 TsaB [Gammaproteobacteria bacterium]|nr:tRNA (adenosine(37)-N6)-threonylcarbamoyltransferase complex dimerization subunit type 1 TsaB [Gammaproteobacteria bacterium]MDH3905858.1 tRNA (adenosine(37)-N6)-threonylcarbamoyltransferase complex dimerization subunit type 1 TsaB [Gammaproteobacteria bacterium]NCF59200.1 tRNA (adenosine(37)-N6)-threonylcarbamoyltransferase complex dimerization subunit type 1 TsaB [Gammaproteobacteria bacterium]